MAEQIITPTETVVAIDQARFDLLSESNHEISKLAEGIVRLLAIRRDDDFLMYHGMLARIQQLSEMQFFALRLHGERAELEVQQWGGMAEIRNTERLYRGMLPA